jgi:hypothetical protein
MLTSGSLDKKVILYQYFERLLLGLRTTVLPCFGSPVHVSRFLGRNRVNFSFTAMLIIIFYPILRTPIIPAFRQQPNLR